MSAKFYSSNVHEDEVSYGLLILQVTDLTARKRKEHRAKLRCRLCWLTGLKILQTTVTACRCLHGDNFVTSEEKTNNKTTTKKTSENNRKNKNSGTKRKQTKQTPLLRRPLKHAELAAAGQRKARINIPARRLVIRRCQDESCAGKYLPSSWMVGTRGSTYPAPPCYPPATLCNTTARTSSLGMVNVKTETSDRTKLTKCED